MRQRSRAFIVADASNSTNRFVFINAGQSAVCICNTGSYFLAWHRPRDITMMRHLARHVDIAFGDSGIRRCIVSELSKLFPGVYSDRNVAIVSTHQHAGAGGYPENLLPQITSLGYVRETADAIVQGTVLAVQRAHASLAPGSLAFGNVNVNGGNRNRSPSAYLANPAEERAQYDGDQDTALTLLKFADASGAARGFLAFFAVHGTSLHEVGLLSVLG
jgi:neutral ceramidase